MRIENLGRCYELSYKFVLDNPEFKLIHGSITNFNPPHQTINHAWTEKDNIIYDPVLEKEYSKDLFKRLFSSKEERIYNFNEMVKVVNKFETFGPWH